MCGMVVRRCIKWFPWFEERKLVMLSNWLVLLTWCAAAAGRGGGWWCGAGGGGGGGRG